MNGSEEIPVILIPGIGGSDLDYAPTRGMWRNGFPNDVLKGFAGEPQNLEFDESGEPRSDGISADITATKFYNVPGSKNITNLSAFLQKNGLVKQQNLFEFYYDFRFSVPSTTQLLDKFINRVKVQTGSSQVDIVAHSMGGLIAKQYLLDKNDNAANVRELIFVAAPHLGAPKALKTLRYGDNLGVVIIDGCKLKRVSHNLPSMFNLLPGRRYFEAAGHRFNNNGGYFEDAGDIDGDGIKGILNFEQTIYNLQNGKESRCLLKPEIDTEPMVGLSSKLIENQLVKFRQQQDSWKKPANTAVFSIIGYGIPTLKTLAEKDGTITLTYTTEGDGTVPLWSADGVETDQTYYVNLKPIKSDHSRMIGDGRIDRQILNLLRRGAGIYNNEFTITRPDRKQFSESVKIDR